MADDRRRNGDSVADDGSATKPERGPKPGDAPSPATPAMPAGRPALAAGTLVGRYQVVRLVGEGGMGTVYEALDARLGRRVALKVLSPELKSKRKAAKRFAIEAQAAARLDHPNVVRIYDFDMACDIPYMAMEFMEGETLAAEIARGPLAFDRLANVMLAVCAGVHAAHQAGIVHRDLKPSNIFLCTNWQGRQTARVLDFGISKVGGVSGSGLTETGDIVGTSQYLSPEQAAGARHVNEASDQYSLGVVMYEALTQKTPQQGLPIHVLLRNVTRGQHARPREWRPDLPAALEAVIERAMSLRPKHRFPSVHALGRALLPFASTEARRPFEDYYQGDDGTRWVADATGPASTDEVAASTGPTLQQTQPPAPSWQLRTTRTSVRRSSVRAEAELPLVNAPRPRGALYSVAVGAVLAALALVTVLLVLRP